MAESVVRVQALDGAWETVGVDRLAGVWPENLELSSDQWGSKGCTFDLRRDPTASWPDLLAFTPIEVDIDGQLSWSGRVSETPSRDGTDRVMSVVGEGWQHHLDDDLVDRMWVRDSLSGWQDQRQVLNANLTNFPAASTVQIGQGAIILGHAKGAEITGGLRRTAVLYDAGPGRTIKRLVAAWESLATSTPSRLFVLIGNGPDCSAFSVGDYDYTPGPTASAGASGTLAVSSSVGRRYAFVYLEHSASGVFTQDELWRISSVKLFTESAFESGNASVLKASRVVSDVLDAGTPLLSTDRSGITATSFSLPEYAPDGPRTPREHVAAVNAFHGWLAKVDPDRRMVFQAEPSRPRFTVGDWSAVELQDASQNSGQDIYNRVLVTGQDPAGQPVQVVRNAAFTGSAQSTAGVPMFPNPSFETNTTGWTTSPGTLARTTTAGEFESGAGGGRLTTSANVGSTQTDLTGGSIIVGRTYRITLRAKRNATVPDAITLLFITDVAGHYAAVQTTMSTSFATYTIDYTAQPGDTIFGFSLSINATAGVGIVYFDSMTIGALGDTLSQRRGFNRTKQLQVSPTLPSDGVAATALGDAWLSGHASTPFRGTIVATGPDAIRDRASGQPIPPHQLLRETGELIHLSDRINPDTGGVGRDARITAVTYRPDTEQATITLDNTRSDLDALLSRLAVVQGAA